MLRAYSLAMCACYMWQKYTLDGIERLPITYNRVWELISYDGRHELWNIAGGSQN